MSFNSVAFLILIIATGLMLYIAYLCFQKRQIAVAKYCGLVMIAASFYSFGSAFEYMSTDLSTIKFWLKIEYIGIPFISTLWLILVLHYTGFYGWFRKWIPLLFIIPMITLLLHYTNDFDHFFYRDILLNKDGNIGSTVQLLKGPWYWVHISYNYLQAILGMCLFVYMYWKAAPLVKNQIIMIMLGAVAPWVANVIYLMGHFNTYIDLTPAGFVLTGYFFIRGIYRFNMFKLTPIAMKTVFETIQDGVMILDNENNITKLNLSAKRMLKGGIHPFEQVNGSAVDVFSHYPEICMSIVRQENSESHLTIQHKDGPQYYQVKISILYDKRKNMIGKLLLFSDITQVTLYQEKLLSNATQLTEFSAFKDKLFTVVAHDIRDPLAMLISLTEIVEEDLQHIESDSMEVFREVSEQVKGTYTMVEEMLDWYRSQNGKMGFKPHVWNLKTIGKQSIQVMKVRSDIKQIIVTEEIDKEITVFADKEMIDLVLRNLISNAIKFTDSSGTIKISAFLKDKQVIISVQDSGQGVNEQIAQTLFQDIQKISGAGTEGEKGTGLGLYLSSKLVEINGGDIWYESKLGQGSTFFFSLPVQE